MSNLLEIKNLKKYFMTPAGSLHAVDDVSLTIEKGETFGLLGETGAGKTTLVNLLMRFYEVDSGVIRVDGTSVADMSRYAVHSMFSMVLQDIWLFDGTIRENLSFNMGEIPEETTCSNG